MTTCEELAQIVANEGFKIEHISRNRVEGEEADRCYVDFRHPKMPRDYLPVGYFWSSVAYWPNYAKDGNDHLETTIRVPLFKDKIKKGMTFKDFQGADSCCEGDKDLFEPCENKCRTHVAVYDDLSTFSVEAKFNKGAVLNRFKHTLREML